MREAQKGFTTMKTAEATTTDTAATVAEQGATVAPEKATSKKGRHPEEGRAQRPESRQGRQSQGRAEERRKGRQESGAARPHEEGQDASRGEQGRGGRGAHRLGRPTACAVSFRLPRRSTASRSSPRRRKLAPHLPDQKVGHSGSKSNEPPPARVGDFFCRLYREVDSVTRAAPYDSGTGTETVEARFGWRVRRPKPSQPFAPRD